MADDSSPIDHKRHAPGDAKERVEDAVALRNGFPGVAEQRKAGADLPSEVAVRGFAVDADAQNLSASSFKEGDTSLVRLQLVRSGGSLGENVKHQDDRFCTLEITKVNLPAVLIGKREIRRPVAG